MIKEYTGRTIRLIFGLVLYGLGSYMSIQANVGLAPWDAFSMGISYKTGIMYGNVVVYTGFLIIIIDFLLKEKIGFGTIINAILIGKAVDLCNYLGLLPMLDNFAAGVDVYKRQQRNRGTTDQQSRTADRPLAQASPPALPDGFPVHMAHATACRHTRSGSHDLSPAPDTSLCASVTYSPPPADFAFPLKIQTQFLL